MILVIYLTRNHDLNQQEGQTRVSAPTLFS